MNEKNFNLRMNLNIMYGFNEGKQWQTGEKLKNWYENIPK